MKIAFFIPSFPELSESFILRQVTGVHDRGHDVRIFAQRRASGATHPEVDRYDMLERTRYLGAADRRTRRPRRTTAPARSILRAAAAAVRLSASPAARKRIAALYRTATLLREESADIVHCHYGETGLLYGFAAPLWDAPLIVSFYGYDCSSYVAAHGRDVYHELFVRAAAVVTLGERMRNRLLDLGAPPDRTVIIPLSVDTREFAPAPTGTVRAPRMLTVARLVEKKGIAWALRAYAKVSTAWPDLTFDIIGDGPLRADLERLAAELGVSDGVRFRGSCTGPEVATALRECDVFVLPSTVASDGDEEGTPTVLLEAAACAVPVVSTWHAGIPDIVEHGVTGLLVPERDAAALAGALHSLLADPDRRTSMGLEARRLAVERFDVQHAAARLESLYQRVLDATQLHDQPADRSALA